MNDLRKQTTQAEMNRWAELSGDFNPLHNDPAYAAGTRYHGTILHGHMTIAWLNEWALREFGPPWLTRGHINDLRFRAPLRADTTYVIRGETTDDPNQRQLTVLLPDGSAGVTATAGIEAQEAT